MKTSYGQQICYEYIRAIAPVEPEQNVRPSWLFGMELDFYFPDHNLAIEFNGDQHYFSTGLSADPRPQQQRDWRKRWICKQRGIKLIRVKAIDLVYSRMRGILKKHFALKKHKKRTELDAKAKAYRKMLVERYDSPTAVKSKGGARAKVVERLFDKHPQIKDGKWNREHYVYNLKKWLKQHGKTPQAIEKFEEQNAQYLRLRHLRDLAAKKNMFAMPKSKKRKRADREFEPVSIPKHAFMDIPGS